MSIRVLVVDDTIFYRKIVTDVLSEMTDIEVVGSANNGKIALARIKSLKPDLITLDVEMPIMNGLEVLEKIQQENIEVDCLLVSSKTEQGGAITMEALALGAFDFITKPDSGDADQNREFMSKELRKAIQGFRRQFSRGKKQGAKRRISTPNKTPPKLSKAKTLLAQSKRNEKSIAIAIGISTGGPNALMQMLPQLPANIGVPVLLVQHMPPLFTESLAKSLNSKCSLTVKEAVNGEKVENNIIYIAPGGSQMKVASSVGMEKVIRIMDAPPENNCKPSVDYLFRSMAREYGSKTTCVIMTGMGTDGKLGCIVTKSAGAVIISQDEESCVVYGMPKEIAKAGLADTVAPLDELAAHILATI